MSISSEIEQFNVEPPINLYTKRGSGFSENTEISEVEDNSNDNIIFQKEDSSLETDKNDKNNSYCGMQGNSELSCILNIAVSSIGGGCFSFPYIVYEGGIMVSLFIFIFVTFCIYYSVDLLRSFVVDTKYFSFSLMTETILGSKWLTIYAFSSFIIYTRYGSWIFKLNLYICEWNV